MGYQAITLIIIAIVNIVIGVVVFSRHTQQSTHRTFLLLTIAVGLWSSSLGFSYLTSDIDWLYFFNNIYYAAALLIAVSFYLFVKTQKDGRLAPGNYLHLLVPVGCALLVSGRPDIFVRLVVGDPSATVVQQPAFLIYSLTFCGYLLVDIILLLRNILYAETRRRPQLIMVEIGAGFSGIAGVIFNLLLPAMGFYELVLVGPILSIVFLIATAYAVVRYKLFDLRAALSRTLAYLLALFSIVITYAVILLLVGQSFFVNNQTSTAQNLVYLALAIIIAFSFQPLKKFFDRITWNIFFQKSYNPEAVIELLGDNMLDSSSLSSLLARAESTLDQTLLVEHLSIVVVDASGNITHTHGLRSHISRGNYAACIEVLERVQGDKNLIDYDEAETENTPELKDAMDSIEAVLITKMKTKSHKIGYIFIGPKRSGQAFTSIDTYVMNTASDELALAVQNMLRFSEIEAFNKTLQDRVDTATEQLRATNSKLRLLDTSKDEFISMASHQLRTPLTSVKGYLSMAIEGDFGALKPEQKKVLEEAYTSTQRMVYLINDFLNVSRLQTGSFQLEPSLVNLSAVIADEITQLQSAALARNVRLVYDPPSSFPTLNLDENKIRQVMMNLIDNAIYYAKPGQGTVVMTLARHSGHISFKVSDDGIGVPKSEQHHLFSKFYRASNARRVRPDGTGIGLFMAKKVVIAHGGAMIFESVQGQGSTFGFRLPLTDEAKK